MRIAAEHDDAASGLEERQEARDEQEVPQMVGQELQLDVVLRRGSGRAMMPALQMMPSNRSPRSTRREANARTLLGSESSHAMGKARGPSDAQAALALSKVRPVATTCAPRRTSTRAVSAPRPAVAPVTR